MEEIENYCDFYDSLKVIVLKDFKNFSLFFKY